MNKRLISEYREFIYKGEQTPFTLGTIAVIIFCVTLLIAATFTKIDISHYWLIGTDAGLKLGTKTYHLVPQVPVVMLTAALLGARFGTLTMFLYLMIGFFIWPVFAFGGGLSYIKSYFFGYILGFFVANIFAGRILSQKYSFKNMFYASVIGVLSIHLCGILYSFILGIFHSSHYHPNFHLIFVQIVYDIIFSYIAILIAKPAKYILWIAMKNEIRKLKKRKESLQ